MNYLYNSKNIIPLQFSRNINYIAGATNGNRVYKEQIKSHIKSNQINEILFLDTIKGVSVSFIKTIIKDLVHEYGESKTLEMVEF